MDFFVYTWLSDRRWFFSILAPSPYKLWYDSLHFPLSDFTLSRLLPFVLNLFFVSYNSYLLYYSKLGFCFENYRSWLEARNILIMISEFLIAMMIIQSIKAKKKVEFSPISLNKFPVAKAKVREFGLQRDITEQI